MCLAEKRTLFALAAVWVEGAAAEDAGRALAFPDAEGYANLEAYLADLREQT